jgi:nitrite reductase/ring-hydroxylating ferredoxin subunit
MESTRREFVTAAAAATVAAGCALCTFCAGNASAARVEIKEGEVEVGNKSDYDKDGVFGKFARDEQVILVRHEGKLYACSALCTHKTAHLKVVDGQIRCPSHGSRFGDDGKVTKGPARKDLPRFAIKSDSAGKLTVDRSKKFEKEKWDEPAAFVKVV